MSANPSVPRTDRQRELEWWQEFLGRVICERALLLHVRDQGYAEWIDSRGRRLDLEAAIAADQAVLDQIEARLAKLGADIERARPSVPILPCMGWPIGRRRP